MTAVEPDFDNTLPWLVAGVPDDRLIASVVEIMRDHPHSPVTVVTRDINVQNKARFARIPYAEPPDPPPGQPLTQRRQGPRPDVAIVDKLARGTASGTVIGFSGSVQNLGLRPIRVDLRAAVDDTPVECQPAFLDLLVNQEPKPVTVLVPRDQLADLMHECNHDPTLYGRALSLTVAVDGEEVASDTWTEPVYDPETNRGWHDVQARYWRIGRGEETEADRRAEHHSRLIRQRDERLEAESSARSWAD
jgi:hypothetical protein